jgi:C-terminal processing protease CtpA/Prc
LVFNTFNGLAIEELDKVFAEFNAANVDELVIDLRYNGGGLVSAAQHFASLMVPSQNVGDLFVAEEFNDKNSDLNNLLFFEETEQNLTGINRILFITTGGTASASELVINGLKPYIDVAIIGQNTSGKYVGASLVTFEDYTFVPITFQSANANGDVFIGGFTPDIDANDDITHNFGDVNEEMFGTALDFLTGKISGARKSAAEIKPLKIYNQETYWNGPAIDKIERLN